MEEEQYANLPMIPVTAIGGLLQRYAQAEPDSDRKSSIAREIVAWLSGHIPDDLLVAALEDAHRMGPRRWDQVPLTLNAEAAARLLRVHPDTVKAMCRTGELPAVKAGRAWVIQRDAVRAFLEGRDGHRVPAS